MRLLKSALDKPRAVAIFWFMVLAGILPQFRLAFCGVVENGYGLGPSLAGRGI